MLFHCIEVNALKIRSDTIVVLGYFPPDYVEGAVVKKITCLAGILLKLMGA